MSSKNDQSQNKGQKNQKNSDRRDRDHNSEAFQRMKNKQAEIFKKLNDNKNKQKTLFDELANLKQQLTGRVQFQKNPENKKVFDKIKDLQSKSKELNDKIIERKKVLPDAKNEFRYIRTVQKCLEEIKKLDYEYQTNNFNLEEDRKLKDKIDRLKKYSTQIADIEKASIEVDELQKERKTIQLQLQDLYKQKEELLSEAMNQAERVNQQKLSNQAIQDKRDELKKQINELKKKEKELYKLKDDAYNEYQETKKQKQEEFELQKQKREKIKSILQEIRNLGVFYTQRHDGQHRIELRQQETEKRDDTERVKLINLLQQKLAERLQFEQSGAEKPDTDQTPSQTTTGTGKKRRTVVLEGYADDALFTQFKISKDELESSERIQGALYRLKQPQALPEDQEAAQRRESLETYMQQLRELGAEVVLRSVPAE